MFYKKVLLAIALLSLTLIEASSLKPVELTVINKSGMEIALGLIELHQHGSYYLHVDEGTKSIPVKEVFAIERAEYKMNVYYIQIYDPVYGYECDQPGSSTWLAFRNLKITVQPCDAPATNRGELPQIKTDSWETIY